jgi:hemerythrin
MKFIEWKDEFNTGIKEIDNQHRGLFDIINKLTSTNRIDPEGRYFFITFSKLIDYARLHFLTEERYMRDAGYSNLDEHQKEHGNFLAAVTNMLQKLENKVPQTENDILTFLKEWYQEHILGSDREYIEPLKRKGFK